MKGVTGEKTIPGKTNNKSKGPEAGACPVCRGKSKEASVAKVDKSEGRKGERQGKES